MKKLKIIYFDSVGIDSVTFEGRLRSLCLSIFIIKDGLILASYEGSSKDLFDQLFPSESLGNVLIIDLDVSSNSYWGFMSKDLWTWLNENK